MTRLQAEPQQGLQPQRPALCQGPDAQQLLTALLQGHHPAELEEMEDPHLQSNAREVSVRLAAVLLLVLSNLLAALPSSRAHQALLRKQEQLAACAGRMRLCAHRR